MINFTGFVPYLALTRVTLWFDCLSSSAGIRRRDLPARGAQIPTEKRHIIHYLLKTQTHTQKRIKDERNEKK